MFNNKHYIILTIVLFSLNYSTIVFAAIYKCKNAAGETIYSSKKCAETAEEFIPVLDKVSKSNESAEPEEVKPKVDIYITSWCPYCKKAMAYLKSKDIAFTAYDIEKDAKANAEKQKIFPEATGVPLTVINGKKIKGFSQATFDRAIAKNIK